jgi:2-methylcitrate dehydratase PrpD
MTTSDAVEFTHTASLTGQNDSVKTHVRTRVLDTLAAITGGYQMSGTAAIRGFARERHTADVATILDGSHESGSVPEVVLANATAANKLDIDDGHRQVKGHPAAVVVPAALAAAEAEAKTIGAFLDAVYVGYEVAVRTGLAIHETDGVYTGTGSWGAVGAAAAVARLRGLTVKKTANALGAAEYHAPRTPIMRGVEKPGMTKDGIGWGSYAGVTAIELARRGFTASGTVFDDERVTRTASLGDTHHTTRGYLKPYPCCRWAHPGIDAVLELRREAQIDPSAVVAVNVRTFSEATNLDTRNPSTVSEAEYSYPYPVAAALVHGKFTAEELKHSARTNDEILQVAEKTNLVADETIDARFPDECLARVTIEQDGRVHESNLTRPRGAQNRPLDTAAQWEKVERLCHPMISATELRDVQHALEDRSNSITALIAPWQ